jgi:putative ABC transport system permease protein
MPFASDLKVAWRAFVKHKAHTLISTAGLAVGAAACLLISVYVHHELNYDSFHRDGVRIYRLLVKSSFSKGRPSASTPEPAAPTLLSDFPEVEAAARIQRSFRAPVVGRETRLSPEERILYADPAIFDILTVRFVRGRREDALTRPATMVLTASLSAKYFGAADPLGQTLLVDGSPTEVVAVIEDAPSNSHLQYRAFRSFLTLQSSGRSADWTRYDPHTYLKLRPRTDVAAFASKVARLSEPYMGPEDFARYPQEYLIQPVRDIHLDRAVVSNLEPSGNTQTLLLLSALALIILALAVLNYVNMATARSAGRAKEVGIRKAVGAEKPRLIRQFMAESFLVTAAAFGAGLALAAVALGPFNRFAGTAFGLGDLVRPGLWPVQLALLLATTVAAGLYPALFLASFSPVAVMRKEASVRLRGGFLRRTFVVGQFAVAVALIAVTLGMARQVRYMKNAPLGFDKEQKLVVVFPGGRGSLPSAVKADRQVSIKVALERHPGVLSATLSSSVPGRGFFYNGTGHPGQDRKDSKPVHYLMADAGFLENYKIELIAGRPILEGGEEREALLNETAMRLFDWPRPEAALGQKLASGDGEFEIVGVIRDFHMEGLQAPIKPLIIGRRADGYHMVSLTFDARRTGEVLGRVRETWAAMVPDRPLDYFFLDEDFARQYRREERTTALFSTFAELGIFVACLGLVGLASFLAEKRTKEIGIRKVLGATVPGILGLLAKEFAAGIVVANVFAWPAAWLVVKRWLGGFAYRAAPSAGTFLAAGGLALTMAMLSVTWRSLRAARANPVDSLRYE